MVKQYDSGGLRFRYPDNWQIEEEQDEDRQTIFLQSPRTAFFLVARDPEMPEPDRMLASTIDALKQEYQDLEVYDCIDSIAGFPALGHDIQFSSLDLTNTCRVRSFEAEGETLLVMWQATDSDMDELEDVLRAISASIELEV